MSSPGSGCTPVPTATSQYPSPDFAKLFISQRGSPIAAWYSILVALASEIPTKDAKSPILTSNNFLLFKEIDSKEEEDEDAEVESSFPESVL